MNTIEQIQIGKPSFAPGFRFGLKHPSFFLPVKFPVSTSGNTTENILGQERLDRLDHYFSSICASYVAPVDTQSDDMSECLSQRVLFWVAEIQREAGLPVFEQGRFKRRNRNELTFAIPCYEFAPAPAIGITRWVLLQIQKLIFSYSAELESVEQFALGFTQQLLEPLKSTVPSGINIFYLLSAASERGIPWRYMGDSCYRLGWGRYNRLHSSSMTDATPALGTRLAKNKRTTAHLLQQVGLPVPKHKVVVSSEELHRAADALGFPLVTKPINQERSLGVSTNLRDDTSLLKGFEVAQSFSNQVLVEKHIPGTCHRLTVVSGRVEAVVIRHPSGVFADGVHSVQQLIEQANQLPERQGANPSRKLIPLDEEGLEVLAEQGLTASTIPEQGRYVCVRRVTSDQWGGTTVVLTEQLHPANRDIAVKAAELFRLDIAGVDLITQDISVPWYDNGAVINEVNASPQIGRKSRYVFDRILDDVFANGRSRIPIDIFVGEADDALALALQHQQALNHQQDQMGSLPDSVVSVKEQSFNCLLVTEEQVLRADGQVYPVACQGLFQTIQALLTDAQVDHLLLVVNSDELVKTGLPFDRFDRLMICQPGAQQRYGALISFLQDNCLAPSVTIHR